MMLRSVATINVSTRKLAIKPDRPHAGIQYNGRHRSILRAMNPAIRYPGAKIAARKRNPTPGAAISHTNKAQKRQHIPSGAPPHAVSGFQIISRSTNPQIADQGSKMAIVKRTNLDSTMVLLCRLGEPAVLAFETNTKVPPLVVPDNSAIFQQRFRQVWKTASREILRLPFKPGASP
jgi:hypothetical protein